jgi:tetratricopeptide (TPR) repeat protein
MDALDKKGEKGPTMDYLYGMAFAFKARGYVQEGAPGSAIGPAYSDAVDFLGRATKAEPVLFSDAFYYLADAAWFSQKLDVARAAAQKALEVAPKDAEAAFLLGRIALAQFGEANADEAHKGEADAHWEAARAAYQKSAEIFATRADAASKSRLASAHVELARTFAWKQKTDDVAREYAAAIAIDPRAVDFGEVQRILPGDRFLAALEVIAKEWPKTHGTEDKVSEATVLWWLGYARYQAKQYATADDAFQSAVARCPEFTNSWYYSALARYQQQKFPEAIEALRAHFAANPADLVAAIETNRDYNLAILDGLVGKSKAKEKNLDAAFVTEIQIGVVPTEPRYWNNLGLFYRDAGDALDEGSKAEDKAKAQALWEKALKAYERALTLAPEDPNYLNDLAVVLHYNLHRELDRAKALYEKALANATKELERKDLTPDMREIRQIAQRDARNNLAKLARETEKKDEKKQQGG